MNFLDQSQQFTFNTPIKQMSLKHINSRSYVLNQPIKSLKKSLSCVCTTAYYFPVPGFIHCFQVQNLLQNKNEKKKIIHQE